MPMCKTILQRVEHCPGHWARTTRIYSSNLAIHTLPSAN